LLPFVATGRYRDRVGPAAELINTFETAVTSSGGLFGAADIPVALIGTSYSAKAEFHFEGFLKHALQANVLNLSRVGQGPFRPMDAFLEERSTLSSLPSIVVWEIPERFLTSQRQLP
jgi:alginate O-acetyltransferase complex protein AlgJ